MWQLWQNRLMAPVSTCTPLVVVVQLHVAVANAYEHNPVSYVGKWCVLYSIPTLSCCAQHGCTISLYTYSDKCMNCDTYFSDYMRVQRSLFTRCIRRNHLAFVPQRHHLSTIIPWHLRGQWADLLSDVGDVISDIWQSYLIRLQCDVHICSYIYIYIYIYIYFCLCICFFRLPHHWNSTCMFFWFLC